VAVDYILLGNGAGLVNKIKPGFRIAFDRNGDLITIRETMSGGGLVDLASEVTGILPQPNGGTGVNVATTAFSLGSGQLQFPAVQNPSADVNTLDDYEEGTWTPVDSSGAGLAFVFAAGVYAKIGSLVQVSLQITYPATADGSTVLIGNLPFSSSGNAALAVGYHANAPATQLLLMIDGGAPTIKAWAPVTGAQYTNANLSNAGFVASGVYRV
jgi:hypothetical protein